MVVCKFFQDGYCRYGQNCRFEHVYGTKYSYNANAAPVTPQPMKQASGGVTDEQLLQQVHNDVQSALKGGQWILSCYAPFKKPNFPGLTDLSAEEARLFIYEARANNTVEQSVAFINNLTKEARRKYEELLITSPNMVQTLRTLYNAVQNTPQTLSPFGQSNSAFGQPNVFAQQDTAKSLFSQTTQNVFGAPPVQNQSVFGSPPAQSQAVFGSPSAQSQNVFGAQSPQNQNVFGAQSAQNQSVFGQPAQQNVFAQNTAQSIFAQANTADPAKSLFAQAAGSPFESTTPFRSPFEQPSPFAQTSNAASVFGQATNVFQQTPVDDPAVYSNMNDLSPGDLEMFNADSFKLGFIPEMPPPHALCV